MTKHLNIYITNEEHKILEDLKYRYRVSISTIANTLMLVYSFNEKTAQLIKQNLKQKGQRKTHIKVSNWNEDTDTNKNYSNGIHIYCNKLDKNILDQREYQSIHNKIHDKLKKAEEPWYDYNRYVRMHKRIENENS